VCTSVTEHLDVVAHGRGQDQWTRFSSALVYYDHPVRATSDHAMVIDFRANGHSPSSRVVIEMTAESAAELARAIERVLTTEPASADLARANASL
jgi:hypothetical protein